ncbi:pollen-specific leucine-rich repeat extensin-like protein 3 [Iris pallida]|uniref:Pollen-specific leucine-rich repeat extensin-like protein 3 n=1 Tax=Iris pallida TaxID=29817 RepID=A0AAX6H8U8_IRIPA|nr:pollen-specific leucine-rich repeat extensin-like protein 3 [Iris pallida]
MRMMEVVPVVASGRRERGCGKSGWSGSSGRLGTEESDVVLSVSVCRYGTGSDLVSGMSNMRNL